MNDSSDLSDPKDRDRWDRTLLYSSDPNDRNNYMETRLKGIQRQNHAIQRQNHAIHSFFRMMASEKAIIAWKCPHQEGRNKKQMVGYEI